MMLGSVLDHTGSVGSVTIRRYRYVWPSSSGAGDVKPSSSSDPSLFQAARLEYALAIRGRLDRLTPIAVRSDTRVTRVSANGSVTALRYPGRALAGVAALTKRMAPGAAA